MQLKGLRSIRAAKVTAYLLNDTHPTSAAKAKFFKSFGFDELNAERLEAAILRHPMDNDVLKTTETQFGTKSIVACSLGTPDQRNPCIITVWIKPPGSAAHRFVTAYPRP
jgi:hypothetical protein